MFCSFLTFFSKIEAEMTALFFVLRIATDLQAFSLRVSISYMVKIRYLSNKYFNVNAVIVKKVAK